MSLTSITTANLIDIIGTILVVVTIGVSIFQFSTNIRHSIIEAKKQMALDQTSQLPLYVARFCSSASNVAAYLVQEPKMLDDLSKIIFEQSKAMQNQLQETIKEQIIAYGSKNAIDIFNQFETLVKNPKNEQIAIEVYYLLPLLMAQVRADVTGEVINPIILFHLLMPQFLKHDDMAIQYINTTIANSRLDSKLTATKID